MVIVIASVLAFFLAAAVVVAAFAFAVDPRHLGMK
jgi:hypothetical protein